MGDGPIQVSRHSGRGISFTRQTKIPNLGSEAMWVDGARREHDIASREVLQYTACLRRRGGWGRGYEGGNWGSRVGLQATCIITLHQQVAESQIYPMCYVFVMEEGHSRGSLRGSHGHGA